MLVQDSRALLIDLFDALNRREPQAALVERFAPGFVNHNPLQGKDANLQRSARDVSALIAAFPDCRFTVLDVAAEGDRVFARVAFQGTHLGPLWGMPPTGRRVAFEAIEEYRVVDGKLAEKWIALDRLSLLRQLGILPPTALFAVARYFVRPVPGIALQSGRAAGRIARRCADLAERALASRRAGR